MSAFREVLDRLQEVSGLETVWEGANESIRTAASEAVSSTITSECDLPESARAYLDNEAVAALAYLLWLNRGCPNGSPEEDWFRNLLGRRW